MFFFWVKAGFTFNGSLKVFSMNRINFFRKSISFSFWVVKTHFLLIKSSNLADANFWIHSDSFVERLFCNKNNNSPFWLTRRSSTIWIFNRHSLVMVYPRVKSTRMTVCISFMKCCLTSISVNIFRISFDRCSVWFVRLCEWQYQPSVTWAKKRLWLSSQKKVSV